MGFGPFSTESKVKSSTTDTDLIGTDQAIVFNVSTAKKGKATVLSPGSTSVAGDLTISSDPALLQNALIFGQTQAQTFADALKEVVSGTSAGAASQAKTLQEVFAKSLEKLGILAEGKQSEGDADRNKIVLYVVLGLLAVVAAIFVFGKRR